MCEVKGQSNILHVSGNKNKAEVDILQFSQFSPVQSLSHVHLFATPWTAAHSGFPVHNQLPEFTQTPVH